MYFDHIDTTIMILGERKIPSPIKRGEKESDNCRGTDHHSQDISTAGIGRYMGFLLNVSS